MATTPFALWNARVGGVVLLLLGVLGFFYDGIVSAQVMRFEAAHTALHLVLGAVALLVGFVPASPLSPIWYGRAFGSVYVVLGLLGFVAPEALSFASIRLEAGENGLHLALGAAALVAGFVVKRPLPGPGAPPEHRTDANT